MSTWVINIIASNFFIGEKIMSDKKGKNVRISFITTKHYMSELYIYFWQNFCHNVLLSSQRNAGMTIGTSVLPCHFYTTCIKSR